MIKREVVDVIGYLPEVYGWGAGEDAEYCALAEYDGYKIAQVPTEGNLGVDHENGLVINDFPIFHKPESTVKTELKDIWDEHFKANGELLRRRISKVAVVMPAYNAEKTVDKAIHAILNQTHKYLKLIIVDDDSDDDTSVILRNIEEDSIESDRRVFVIRHAKNLGASEARNTALDYIDRNFEGEIDYIAYCDADDYWDAEHLQNCIDELGGRDAVYTDARHIDVNTDEALVPYGIPYFGDYSLANHYIH